MLPSLVSSPEMELADQEGMSHVSTFTRRTAHVHIPESVAGRTNGVHMQMGMHECMIPAVKYFHAGPARLDACEYPN